MGRGWPTSLLEMETNLSASQVREVEKTTAPYFPPFVVLHTHDSWFDNTGWSFNFGGI